MGSNIAINGLVAIVYKAALRENVAKRFVDINATLCAFTRNSMNLYLAI